MTDLCKREARARDELAQVLIGVDWSPETGGWVAPFADAILADFARVAGLLGYVKADVTGVENGVRYWEGDADRVGGQWERVIADFDDEAERKHFYLYAVRCAKTWNAEKSGHRLPELVTRPSVRIPWEPAPESAPVPSDPDTTRRTR